MTNATAGVDFSAFEASVDAVVEAAANRDAEIAQLNDEFTGYSQKLYEEEQELQRQLLAVATKRDYARQVHDRRIAAANAAFHEAGGLDDDEPPF